MKMFIVLVMLVTVVSGVGALGVMMGTKYASLGTTLCPVAIVSGLLFFVLAARQSRKDREAREDRRWQMQQRRD